MSMGRKTIYWIVSWLSPEYPGRHESRFETDTEANKYANLLRSRNRFQIRVDRKEAWPS